MPFKAGAIYGEAILDTHKWSSGVKSMNSSIRSIKGAARLSFTAAAGYMTAATVTANAFQKEMSNVATVIDTAVISTEDMTIALLKLDPRLGKTTELTESLYLAYSAGAETMDEAMQTTIDSAKFAAAALTTSTTALDILTSAQNAYGKETINTTRASDIFFKTIEEGKVTGQQLSATIGQSIPLYASAGVKLEELGAGIATITKQGGSASESTTQLNAIIKTMLKPTTELKEAIKDYGYETGGALLKAEGLSGVLKLVEDSTDGNIDKIGKLTPNVRALRGILALTGEGGEIFNDVLGKITNSVGATDVAFGKQERTFVTLGASLQKTAIVTGNIGKHFVDEIAIGATQANEAIVQFLLSSDGMEAVSDVIAKPAAAMQVLGAAGKILTDDVLWRFEEPLNLIKERMGTFADETNFAQKVVHGFSGMLNIGATVLEIFTVFTTGAITNVVNLSTVMFETTKIAGTFLDVLSGKAKWRDVKDQIGTTKDAFSDLGEGIVGNVKEMGTTVFEGVTDLVIDTKWGADLIKREYKDTYEEVKNSIKDNYSEIITGQKDTSDTIVGMVKDGNELLLENTDETTKTGLSMWETFTKGVKDSFLDAETTVQDVYNNIFDATSFVLDSISQIQTLATNNRLDEIELAKQTELDIIQNQFDQGLISEEEYETQRDNINQEALDKENEAAKSAFETQKQFSIASVWMDAASATVGWWSAASQLGPVAGPIFGVAMTGATVALAAAQAGEISKQQFIPAREKGGMASGITRINEAGGEIVSLPDGSQVIPNDISRQIASNSGVGGNIVNVNFYDTVVKEEADIDYLSDEVSRRIGEELRRAI